MQNYENLDLKKTVETTFERAKGWLRAKYPSAVNSKSNFEIDVRYPGESIPTTGANILIETAWTPMSSKIHFDKAPSLILFRRGNNEVFMKKNIYKTNAGVEEKSYILGIHSGSGANYRMVETPDGTVRGVGNSNLLFAVHQDKDFGQYISFVLKGQQNSIPPNAIQWKLNDIMIRSREG